MQHNSLGARLPVVAVGLLVGLISGGVILAWATSEDAPEPVGRQRAITAYVVASEDATEWLVRIPLDLTEHWGLPRRAPGYVDLDALEEGAARQRFAEDASNMVGLRADGEPVTSTQATLRISPPHSREFDTLEDARAQLGGTQDPDTPVYWNQGFADARFHAPPQSPPFSLALDVPVAARPHTRVSVDFVNDAGETAEYEVSAERDGLPLTHRPLATLGRFLRSGVATPLAAWGLLGFVVVVVLPTGGRPAVAGRLVSVMLGGLTVGALAWRYTDVVADPLVQASLGPATGAAVVWAGVRGLLTRYPDRVGLSTPVWSGVLGFVAADQMEPLVQFSRGIGLLDTIAHVAGTALTMSLVAGLVVGAARMLQRELRTARYGQVIVLLLVVHIGWQELLQRGADVALLALLEVRLVEAGDVVDVLPMLVYAAAVVAVAWAAWELRAFWHGRKPRDSAPSPGHHVTGLSGSPLPDRRAPTPTATQDGGDKIVPTSSRAASDKDRG